MKYDDSPHTIDTTLPIEEVEALLADECRAVHRDKKKVIHVVRRMGVTIRTYRQQIKSLDSTIQMMRLQQERAGQATTLHPRDAVRYLAPEVLSELVEGHLRERIGAVQKALQDTQKTTQNATQELNQVRYATAAILEDNSIPEEIRARIRYLMEQLPAGVGQAPPAPPTGPMVRPLAPPAPSENLDDLFS